MTLGNTDLSTTNRPYPHTKVYSVSFNFFGQTLTTPTPTAAATATITNTTTTTTNKKQKEKIFIICFVGTVKSIFVFNFPTPCNLLHSGVFAILHTTTVRPTQPRRIYKKGLHGSCLRFDCCAVSVCVVFSV